jgi:hypothetical protein
MATIKTDVLQPFEYKGTSFKYYRSNFDKIEFVTPQKRQLKTKTLVSPELSFNPQYLNIHKTIADSNLATDIKEGYENINYQPITSTGYRGFSGLNTRKNGVKLGFNENLSKYNEIIKIPTPDKYNPPVKEKAVVQTPLKSPISFDYTLKEKKPGTQRGSVFKKLNKDRQRALSEEIQENPTQKTFVRRKGQGYLPNPGYLPSSFKNSDEDKEDI